MNEKYDVVCIGAGPGGYTSAIRLSQLGKSVAIIELKKDRVGGICLNEGCIPVKALLKASEMYPLSQKPLKEILGETAKIVAQLKDGLMYLFKKNNITLIEGKARIVGENDINVELFNGEEKTISAKYIVVATGSSPKSIPGLESSGKIITSTEGVGLVDVPKTVTIIGGGPIGIEFAHIFRDFGAEVTLVEMMERLLPQEDEEISNGIERILKKKGIKVVTGQKPGKDDLGAELILLAIGRTPNTAGLGLDSVGVSMERGFVKADNNMMTSRKNIFAVGDIINTPMFAHTACEEAIVASEYISGLSPEPINYLNVPRIVYGDTEVACIGFTEKEARAKGCNFKTSKYFFRANSRSVISQSTEGFIKIIADAETGAFLGVHILGHLSSELIHPFIVAKAAGLSVEDMGRLIFGHPTFSEIIKDACKSVYDRPIHG